VIVSGTGYVTGPRAEAGQRLEAHLKYIQYRAGEEGEGPRTVFGETEDTLALREAHEMILDQGRDGLRFHKIVISPAESERVGDWQAFTRQVMDDLERRVGLQLTWCATVHENTDHPHVHIVLAGDGERADGQVMQARLYTPHYEFLRERAEWHTEQAWDRLLDRPQEQETIPAWQDTGTEVVRGRDEATLRADDGIRTYLCVNGEIDTGGAFIEGDNLYLPRKQAQTLLRYEGWAVKQYTYTKRERDESARLRKEFDEYNGVRGEYLKRLVDTHEAELRAAGLPDADIMRMRDGYCPKNYQVHHKLSLDDEGTNEEDNLLLIRNQSEHTAITSTQNRMTDGMRHGDSRVLDWPVPVRPYVIYPPAEALTPHEIPLMPHDHGG